MDIIYMNTTYGIIALKGKVKLAPGGFSFSGKLPDDPRIPEDQRGKKINVFVYFDGNIANHMTVTKHGLLKKKEIRTFLLVIYRVDNKFVAYPMNEKPELIAARILQLARKQAQFFDTVTKATVSTLSQLQEEYAKSMSDITNIQIPAFLALSRHVNNVVPETVGAILGEKIDGYTLKRLVDLSNEEYMSPPGSRDVPARRTPAVAPVQKKGGKVKAEKKENDQLFEAVKKMVAAGHIETVTRKLREAGIPEERISEMLRRAGEEIMKEGDES